MMDVKTLNKLLRGDTAHGVFFTSDLIVYKPSQTGALLVMDLTESL
jgi:hypothetical protein